MGIVCKTCGVDKFLTWYGLEQHRESVHGVRNPSKCYLCGKLFPRESSMLLHVKSHSNVFLECLTCGKKCVNMSGLIKHAETVHSETDSVTRAVKITSSDQPAVFVSKSSLTIDEKVISER